ncbi:hypothetical protein Tco_1265104 [Tanacetum coccineum]
MIVGQRKLEGQWTRDERKAANLDERLKSLIMFVLQDDQMNSVINCLTTKSTWDDLILYHEGPSDVKETRVIDLKILTAESQRNTTDPSVAINDSSTTEYDSMNESLVCSTPLPPLKKLDGAEPISGPKTIKSILSSSASKVNSAPTGKLKSPLAIFDEKKGTIFNSNKEVVMIALRVRDVYVLDVASFAQEVLLLCQSF